MGVPLLMEPNFRDYSCQVKWIPSLIFPAKQIIQFFGFGNEIDHVSGSLNSAYFLQCPKTIRFLRSLAWRYARTPLDEENSPVAEKWSNARRLDIVSAVQLYLYIAILDCLNIKSNQCLVTTFSRNKYKKIQIYWLRILTSKLLYIIQF